MNAKNKMKNDMAEKIKDYNVHLAYIQDLLTVYNLILDSKESIFSEDFITVTTCGLYDSFIMALARLYDKSESTETIPNLLDKCIKNTHLIGDNEYVQKLNDFNHQLTTNEYISPAIQTITFRRDKMFAHNDKQYFGRKISSDETYLPMYQIWFLVNFTKDVLSYISEIFDVNIESPKFKPKFW